VGELERRRAHRPRARRKATPPALQSAGQPISSPHMKLGLMAGYWMFGPQDPSGLAVEAERLGYDSVWTAEAYGSDAITPLAWIAARTERIRLGTGIMQLAGRPPAMCAM